jgi:hypothetical protein
LCQKSEDCANLLCVRLTPTSGVCSVTCADDSGCPRSDNWGCLQSPTIPQKVCGCLLLSDHEVCDDGLDNDCNGRVDDCKMCDGRSVPEDDPAHCGNCETACRSDQRCERGACKCPLGSPLECAGSCTDSSVDSNHCGGCGLACDASQLCTEGACVCPSSAAPDFCANGGCVSLASDANHCGDCNTACSQGRTCSAGACVCPAGSPPNFCDGVGCVDFQTSVAHCGACDNACVSTQVCSAGSCTCPSGQTLCDGKCVDLKADAQNCGECGETCAVALACITGACSCSAAGYQVCGADCAKLDSDPLHCGDCDTECAAGEACSAGHCGCASGVYCADECMPVDDEQNCGACGKACPASQICQGGTCGCAGFGLTPCGDQCVSLTSDEQHCGNCATVCRNTEECGVLGCDCPGSQTFCDNVNACVSLSTDADHCGNCGNACDPTEICSGSTCQCPVAGALYCASVGACTDTLSNEQHCGACNVACKPTEVCTGGNCACPAGETFCAKANSCVDLQADSSNCGACGTVCPANTHCASGGCACDAANETLCGSVCYDLKTNPDHCGTCGNDCGGNYSCLGGACKCPQPTLGTEVRVTSSGDNTSPRAIWDGTHVGVAFAGYIKLVYRNVRFLLLNPDGTLVPSSEIDIGQNRDEFDMTWSGSEYAVVATSFNGILFRRVGANGIPKDAGVDVSTSNTGPDDFVRVGWSTQQGGYVVIWDGGFPESVNVRPFGTDGGTLGMTKSFENFRAYSRTPLVTTPDGTLGQLLSRDDDFQLSRVDPTSTPIVPAALLDSDNGISLRAGLLYDPNGFVSAWGRGRQVMLNRGNDVNAPVVALTIPPTSFLDSVTLTQTKNSVAIGWAQVDGNGTSDRFRFQRFTQPNAVTGAVTPITDALDIVAAHAGYEVSLVQTGPYRLLAVWSDGREANDTTHSLYAVPIDLKSCP